MSEYRKREHLWKCGDISEGSPELADPRSEDSIEHESTRLTCVATNGGQTSMDLGRWTKWIPGYDALRRDLHETLDAEIEEDTQKIAADISALSLISEDDPPIHMQYGMSPDDPVPPDPEKARGWKVHHVMFGVKLREKMDELGIEANLKYPGARRPMNHGRPSSLPSSPTGVSREGA